MLPREVVVENWPDRATYDFPRRPIGKFRLFGLPLIGFAMLFGWRPGHEVAALLQKLAQGNAGAGDWLIGGFTFLFVIAALVPFALGMFILLGRTRVMVNSRRIRITECAGPLRWSRSIRCDSVVALELGYAKSAFQAAEASTKLPAGLLSLGALVAKKRFGKPAFLLLGYPRDLLDPFAAELTTVLLTFGQKVALKEVSSPLMPSNVVASAPAACEKPADSNIQTLGRTGGLELQVPSRGFFKQSHGLFVFGIFWCLMTGGFSFAFTRGQSGSVESGFIVFMLIFWGVGLAMLGLGLDLGTCRWSLKADSQGLEVTRISALRKRDWKWLRPELARLTVGPSGVTVNNRQMMELQVHTVSGKKKGILGGRDLEELGWVAFSINQALKLGPEVRSDSGPLFRVPV